MYKTLILFLFHFSINAQINGFIIDKETNKGIEGVNIISSNKGTFSDINGQFFIDVPLNSELEFSHIGYKNIYLPAEKNMLIEMEISHLNQEEITILSGISDEYLQGLHSSVSVVTSNNIRLSGFEHFQNITDQISNLNWAGGTSRPRYFQIRGIGERSHYFGEGAPNFSVGFVIDNIDLSGLGMVGFTHDISQIEIFKGPQSTIFGSNSIGGLISLNTNNPSEKFEIKIKSSIGTDGYYNLGSIINFSFYKNFRIRFSSLKNYSNGFRKNDHFKSNDTNKKDEVLNRVKFSYRPIKNLKFLGTYININQRNGYDIWAPDNNKEYITFTDDIGSDSQLTKGFSLKTIFSLTQNIQITGISSLSNVKLQHSYDGDWANGSYWLENYGFDPELEYYEYKFFDKNIRKRKTFIQEIRASIKRLVLGIYYKSLQEKDDASGYLFGGLATEAKSQYTFKASALYVQYAFNFMDKVELKNNIRFEHDNVSYSGESFDNYYYVLLPDVKTKIKSPMLGYSSVISFKKSNFLNYYASFSRGYKSGGINQEPNLSELNRSYQPEYVNNFEIGIKSFKKNFRNQLNIFYSQRRNQQISISSQQNLNDPNSFLFYTANSTRGNITGIEFETKFQFKKFQFGTNLGILRTWLDEFKYELESGRLVTGGNREAAMSPNLSGNLYLLRYFKTGIRIKLSNSYKSSYYFSDNHNYKSSGYNLINLYANYLLGNFELNLWINNLTNEVYETRGFYFALKPYSGDELFKSYGDPRQLGIGLNYNF